MNSNKGFGLVGLLIAVLLIALLSGGAFYGYKGGLFGGGTASSTITGPIDAAKNAKDLLEKKNQEVVKEVSTSSTADWKTYQNDLLGYKLTYPPSWYLKEEQEEPSVWHTSFWKTAPTKNTGPDFGGDVSITVATFNGTDVRKFHEFSNIDFKTECKIIFVAGISGFDCNPAVSLGGEMIISFLKDNHIFTIIYYNKSPELQKILDSFTWIQGSSQTSTVDWKTYKNEEYGFEFKYPTTVTIASKSGPGGTSYFPFSNKILELSGNKLSLYIGVPKNQYFVYATTTGKFLLKGTSEFLSCENSNGTSAAVMPGSSIPVVRGGFGDGRDPGESFYVFKGTKGALAVIVQNQSCDTVSLDGSPYDPKEIESCNNDVKAGDKVKVGILETLKLINGSPQSFYCLINRPDAGIEVRLEFSLLPLSSLSLGFS